MKMINYSFDVEKFVKKWSNIHPIFEQQIVFWAKNGIRSLFILILFEIDRIVHDRLNIAVT
jgi:hypothetical protein